MKNEKSKTKKRPLKIIGNILFYTFLAFVVIIIALSIIGKSSGKSVLPVSPLWVLTDSMEPTIEKQSYVLVEKADVKSLKEGDIITFYLDIDHDGQKELNTHKIIEVIEEGKTFKTKGDKYTTPDDYTVNAEDIWYKYIRPLPVLTLFGRFYATEVGVIATIAVILIGVGIYSAVLIARYKGQNEESEKQKEIDKLVEKEIQKLEEQGGITDSQEKQGK